jgi:hypothetical protein
VAIVLDSNDSTQVASASHIEFETPTLGQKSVIFSGIAIPSWDLNDDSNIYRQTVTVNLRYPVLAVLQATISLGLASIYNGGSDFLYATDSATLCVDASSQELILQVDVALMGDPANLSRFGYQLVVVVTTQVTGISGTIRFPKNVFDPSYLTQPQVSQLFLVSANTETQLPPPSDWSFGSVQYNPVAYGAITGMSIDGNDNVGVTYEISSAPYNQNLYVLVQPGPLYTSGLTSFSQIAGPDPVVLTLSAPSASGVDFTVVDIVVK